MMLPRLVVLCTLATAAVATTAGTDTLVPGQKLDSGLGALPHYSQWTDRTGRDPLGMRVVGESLDDGLGELPHYSKWIDRTGRDPLGRERVALATSKR